MKKTFILFLFITFQILPQLKTLNGIVKDSETKTILQFANVLIKGTNFGTTTDELGRFLLNGNFNDSDTLVVSFVGYKTSISKISEINSDLFIVELQKIFLPSQTILIDARSELILEKKE